METKSYTEMLSFPDYHSRLQYLSMPGSVGELNQEVNRYLNQRFYRSPEWKRIRKEVIIRDNGFDLACEGLEIFGFPAVHHINPVTLDDVINRDPKLFDLENLVLVSTETHNLIHYGVKRLEEQVYEERKPGDTKLW